MFNGFKNALKDGGGTSKEGSGVNEQLSSHISEHLQRITHTLHPKYTLSLLAINTFIFLVMIAAADYRNPITRDGEEG
jgi:hypothetical protein